MGSLSIVNGIKAKGIVELVFRDKNGKFLRVKNYENIITSAGFTAIIRRLINSGSVASEGIITDCALGTGAGTPALEDIAMFTELVRKTCSTRTLLTAASVKFSTFFNSSEGNGTLTEVGLFGEDGNTMFEHCAIAETKTVDETLTANITIVFQNA